MADLDRLALAAVGRAPGGDLGGEHVQRTPEPRPDPGVGRVLHHAAEFAVLDLPADLAAELEVEPLVIDRPRSVGIHIDAGRRLRDYLVEGVRPGLQADVGYAYHRQPRP